MFSIMPLVTAVSSLPISLNGIGVGEALLDELLHALCGAAKGTGMLVSICGMLVYAIRASRGGWFYISRKRHSPPSA
jgi:hypothetical protein